MSDQGFDIKSPNIMLPITVGDFEQAIKQARAEVLAACIADVEKALSIYMEHKGRPKDDKALIGGVCLGIKNRLEQLQPAAKALEELLRKERLDEAKWWEHLSQESHEQHPPYENCMYCTRITELEKARAEGKG